MKSGASFDEKRQVWLPHATTSNATSMPAAQRVFAMLQRPQARHLAIRIVTPLAALRGSKVPPAILTELAEGGHPVAVWLRARAEVHADQLWRHTNGPTAYQCDRRWFVENFLEVIHADRLGDADQIFDLLPAVPLYHVVAGIAAIEDGYFSPVRHGTRPRFGVIGSDRESLSMDGLTKRPGDSGFAVTLEVRRRDGRSFSSAVR
jgi:hypothetical protein